MMIMIFNAVLIENDGEHEFEDDSRPLMLRIISIAGISGWWQPIRILNMALLDSGNAYPVDGSQLVRSVCKHRPQEVHDGLSAKGEEPLKLIRGRWHGVWKMHLFCNFTRWKLTWKKLLERQSLQLVWMQYPQIHSSWIMMHGCFFKKSQANWQSVIETMKRNEETFKCDWF